MNFFFRISFALVASSFLGAYSAASSVFPEKTDLGVADVTQDIEATGREITQRYRQLSSYQDGSSCDCSKAALVEITQAFDDVLGHIPPSFLGLLQRNRDYIEGSLGLDIDAYRDYNTLHEALVDLLDGATEALSCINCGHCDGDEEPYDGISHNECCCDVAYIKDITIKQMYSLVKMALLNPGADEFTSSGMESLKDTAKNTVEKIARPYNCANETSPETPCTCFTKEELLRRAEHSAQDVAPTKAYGCTISRSHERSFINYDNVTYDAEGQLEEGQCPPVAWSPCVGYDCRNDGEGRQELMCYVGQVRLQALEDMGGFKWGENNGEWFSKPISVAEADSCRKIMSEVCVHWFGPAGESDDHVETDESEVDLDMDMVYKQFEQDVFDD